MSIPNIILRLERLEAYLAPPSDEPALVIHLTSIGQPDQIIEVRGTGAPDLRRQPWSRRRAFEGMEMRAIKKGAARVIQINPLHFRLSGTIPRNGRILRAWKFIRAKPRKSYTASWAIASSFLSASPRWTLPLLA